MEFDLRKSFENHLTFTPNPNPNTNYSRFSVCSNGLRRPIHHPNKHIPCKAVTHGAVTHEAATHEAADERMPELIALPDDGLVTAQFDPYLVIEHPNIRCVLCVMRCGSAGGNTPPQHKADPDSVNLSLAVIAFVRQNLMPLA